MQIIFKRTKQNLHHFSYNLTVITAFQKQVPPLKGTLIDKIITGCLRLFWAEFEKTIVFQSYFPENSDFFNFKEFSKAFGAVLILGPFLW